MNGKYQLIPNVRYLYPVKKKKPTTRTCGISRHGKIDMEALIEECIAQGKNPIVALIKTFENLDVPDSVKLRIALWLCETRAGKWGKKRI